MTDERLSKKPEEVFNGVEYATLTPAPMSTLLSDKQKQQCTFQKTLNADIWPTKQVPSISESWHSQAWVEVYLDSLLAWLHDLKDSKVLNKSEPVYLLLLGCERYAFGLALLQKLWQGCQQQGLGDINICLLLCIDDQAMQTQLVRHPDFNEYYQNGQARIVNWDMTSCQPIPSHDIDGETLAIAANPAACLAHGVFSQLPQAVYYMHYQDIYCAEIACLQIPGELEQTHSDKHHQELPLLWDLKTAQSVAKKDDKQRTVYQWSKTNVDREVEQVERELAPQLGTVFRKLIGRGVSQAVAIPLTATQLLFQLEQNFSKGLYQLISDNMVADSGINLPKVLPNTGLDLPVDMNMLSLMNPCSYSSEFEKLHGSDVAIYMSMSHEKSDEFNYTRHVFEKACTYRSPICQAEISQSIKSRARELTETQILAYIRQSKFDPKVLAFFIPRLLKEGVLVENRMQWCHVLSQVWQNHIIDCAHESFAFELGLLAIDFSHWVLAKNCMLACMEINGPNTAYLHNLALVAWATGELEIAAQSAELALDFSPQDVQVKKLNRDIANYLDYCQHIAWFDMKQESTQCEASGLRLLPLGEHQLGEFYSQYRRGEIAERLRGVKLNQFSQLTGIWPTWLEEGCSGKKAHYALVHDSFGFVGAIIVDFYPTPDVSDKQSSQCNAHLSFWVGCDYQNRGFGKIGVNLAVLAIQSLAKSLNISHIKTSAWAHNTASRRILKRVGFTALKETQGTGVEQEVFYQLALAK
ncbi:GNAT family N-acetyltransferase [Pseudoalteromonas obscura]|uniref:GNAT family N-acetyltransferase n=1 Tax=Pseudoalteromonas obscura TaxID=3048491 RepID=A0ABT7EEU2_9GAMM|nr:GNAT family N-acetyltransferase [Pseudoalteromonas sp. P94(2023)]MDK2593805.1 GNAT family N-acetyltransferase [Pseudoalteromonas sp. P94(2023)]